MGWDLSCMCALQAVRTCAATAGNSSRNWELKVCWGPWCLVCCRFKVIDMLQDYEMGPFTVTPLRVTHSIPDCCGLIMRR